MIKHVEDLGAELQVQPFREREFLCQGQVRFRQWGTLQNVAARVPICTGERLNECAGIEIVIGSAEDHRSRKTGVQGRANRIAGIAVVGGIVRQLWREWQTRLKCLNSTELPISDQLAYPGAPARCLPTPEWQIVGRVDDCDAGCRTKEARP